MKYTFSFLLALMLFGCASKKPYTQEIQQNLKLTETELKQIQFYISDDIILNRAEREGKMETSGGEVILKDDQKVEQVIIKAGTPGVVEKVISNDKIAVAFEEGDSKFLVFGSTGVKGSFKLLAEEWKNGRGKVKYGKDVYITSRGSGEAILKIKIKNLNSYKKEQHIAKGKKVN